MFWSHLALLPLFLLCFIPFIFQFLSHPPPLSLPSLSPPPSTCLQHPQSLNQSLPLPVSFPSPPLSHPYVSPTLFHSLLSCLRGKSFPSPVPCPLSPAAVLTSWEIDLRVGAVPGPGA